MTINKRVKKYIALALEESTRSDYKRINIGAVITDGNYVVSKGYNSLRTHPKQSLYNDLTHRTCNRSAIHAEMDAVIKARNYDLSDCSIFIARFDRRGKLAMCKPCPACQRVLSDSGIRKCYFTDSTGIKELIIANV